MLLLSIFNHEDSITRQLITSGFKSSSIFRKSHDTDARVTVMYAMSMAMLGTQGIFVNKEISSDLSILETLIQVEPLVEKAYGCFSDEKSKELFVMKLALLASNMHFALFKRFMLLFSEPIHEHGILNYQGTPEDYLYFNNDALLLEDGEVYVDIGAYDGDTIETFVDACEKKGVSYSQIFGFEPDKDCFERLKPSTSSLANCSVYELGLWKETKTLKFQESAQSAHDQAGQIIEEGETSINVVSIDEFFQNIEVSFIKMDPPGGIINQIIEGGVQTISRDKPKLALGIYHSLDEFIQVPIMLKEICPEYSLVLRHNTYHLCDTDLYAYL